MAQVRMVRRKLLWCWQQQTFLGILTRHSGTKYVKFYVSTSCQFLYLNVICFFCKVGHGSLKQRVDLTAI